MPARLHFFPLAFLAIFWADLLDVRGKGGVFGWINRFVDALLGGRVFLQLGFGADGARAEAAAAVWADVHEHPFGTHLTKSAFKGANHGVCGVWREFFVTIFAIRANLKHFRRFLLLLPHN